MKSAYCMQNLVPDWWFGKSSYSQKEEDLQSATTLGKQRKTFMHDPCTQYPLKVYWKPGNFSSNHPFKFLYFAALFHYYSVIFGIDFTTAHYIILMSCCILQYHILLNFVLFFMIIFIFPIALNYYNIARPCCFLS